MPFPFGNRFSHMLRKLLPAASSICGSFSPGCVFTKPLMKQRLERLCFCSTSGRLLPARFADAQSSAGHLRPDLQVYTETSAKIIPFHQGVRHVCRGPSLRKWLWAGRCNISTSCCLLCVLYRLRWRCLFHRKGGKVHAQTTGTEVINPYE